MRACPFCGAENHEDGSHCVRCARRITVSAQRAAQTPVVRTTKTSVVPPPVGRMGSLAGAPPPPPPRPGSALPVTTMPPPPPPRPASAPPPPSPPPIATATPAPAPAPAALPASAPPEPLFSTPREETPSGATGYVPPLGAGDLPSSHLAPMPEPPDAGLFAFARYAVRFARARLERGRTIKALEAEIESHVGMMDTVFGQLGKLVRTLRVETKALAEENAAIDRVESSRQLSDRTVGELTVHRAEENRKYEEIQRDLTAKLAEREAAQAKAHAELERLEDMRKVLRERRRDLERRWKSILKSAEAREEQATKEQIIETRENLRRSAGELRADAKVLEPELEDLEKQLAASEKPLKEAESADREARAELEAARDALSRAKDGHKHRLVEMDAEQGRRLRDVSVADGEIARRLVTLGTIINLHRVDRAELVPHYDRVDQLRQAIALREGEVDRLNAERAPTHRGALIRGVSVIGVAAILLLTAVCVALALRS